MQRTGIIIKSKKPDATSSRAESPEATLDRVAQLEDYDIELDRSRPVPWEWPDMEQKPG